MNVIVDVLSNIGGYFEFHLCPNDNVTSPITQECLDKYPLTIEGYGSRYVPDTAVKHSLFLKIPDGVTCSQCVLQWKWIGGKCMTQSVIKKSLPPPLLQMTYKLYMIQYFFLKFNFSICFLNQVDCRSTLNLIFVQLCKNKRELKASFEPGMIPKIFFKTHNWYNNCIHIFYDFLLNVIYYRSRVCFILNLVLSFINKT